jgi:hypothetical protein
MQTITEKQLQAVCERINRATGQPLEPYTKTQTGFKTNIGNYHLDHAYGGVSLHRMTSEGGGVTDVFSCGHVPKRDLANRMWAFLNGLEAAKTTVSA